MTALPSRLYADLMRLPFKEGGRGVDGLDCWGTLQAVCVRRGLQPTDFPTDPALLAAALADEWEEVSRAAIGPGDGILLRSVDPRWVWHIGVVLDSYRMLHARENAGVCVERFDSPAYARRIVGFYRFRGRAA